MNLLADEGVDRAVVERLRRDGHDVAESSPSVGDDEVLRQANQRAALLLTADKAFGELVCELAADVRAGMPSVRPRPTFPAR